MVGNRNRLVKTLQQRDRRDRKDTLLSAALLDGALMVLWCTDGSRDACCRYLWHRSQRKSWPQRQRGPLASQTYVAEAVPEHWRAAVDARWAAWSVDDELSLWFPEGLRKVRLQRARTFVQQLQLVQWVQEQNAKAIAPTSVAMWKEKRKAGSNPAGDTSCSRLRCRKEYHVRKRWLRRWCRRHGVQRGRFHVGPAMPLGEARQKARHGALPTHRDCRTLFQIWAPKVARKESWCFFFNQER